MSLVQNCISFDNIVLKTTNLVLCCCLIFASAVTSVIFKQIRDYSLLYEDGYFIWVLWFLLYFLELSIKLPSAQKAVKCFSLTFGLVGIFYFQSRTYLHVICLQELELGAFSCKRRLLQCCVTISLGIFLKIQEFDPFDIDAYEAIFNTFLNGGSVTILLLIFV